MAFQINDEMSPLDISNCSKESLEVKELISNLSINISNLLIENYYDFVKINLARNGNEFSVWMIYGLDELYEDDDNMEEITIGDAVFDHSEEEMNNLILYHENRFVGALAVLKYLFEIFTGSILDANFLTGTPPTQDISNFLVDVFHCEKVQQCEKVMIFQNGISSKTMVDQILDLANGLKSLDFRCPLPDDWSNPKILKLDKLVSWPSEWFTTSDLLTKLDCECAQLNETNLDCRAFKAFMLKWKMLDNTRLKMLEISFDGDWTLFNYDGLDAKKWNPEERDGHYPDLLGKPGAQWLNCEFVMDIQRDDGMLASFWRREQSFHFVVWHDRHPIATLQPDPDLLLKLEEIDFASDEDDDE